MGLRWRRVQNRLRCQPAVSQGSGSCLPKERRIAAPKGTKLYAVRDKKGQFEDIQTYKRAHGQDIKRKSKAETKPKAR